MGCQKMSPIRPNVLTSRYLVEPEKRRGVKSPADWSAKQVIYLYKLER